MKEGMRAYAACLKGKAQIFNFKVSFKDCELTISFLEEIELCYNQVKFKQLAKKIFLIVSDKQILFKKP